jgi:hypothetical protein
MPDVTDPLTWPTPMARLSPAQMLRARRYVAGRALDVPDARELLLMLGLLEVAA